MLIDSEQLEAGDALDNKFRGMAADEIARFRREIIERTGDARAADNISDQELLREVMNTVGKHGQLGGSIRCVVSVSMLTEGWDANTVTHILGIRAFGTQLLCEQVIGRALRRQSYDLNEENLFNIEYADIFGIPFDFTAKPVIAPPQTQRETVQVKAMRPERDGLAIRFPRVEGYRVELPEERLTATFNADSILELSPDLVGPSITRNSGIIGEGVDLNLEHLGDMRPSTLLFHVTKRLLYTKWRDPGEEPKLYLFGQLKRITKQWLDTCLVCKGSHLSCPADVSGAGRHGVQPHHRRHHQRAGRPPAPSRPCSTPTIPPAPRPTSDSTRPERTAGTPVVHRLRTTSTGWCSTVTGKPSSAALPSRIRRSWPTRRTTTWDSKCRIATAPRFESICPTSSSWWTTATAPDNLLHLVVEIKGYRREDAKEKKSTMDTYWVPGVNNLKTYGRWAFAEFTEVYEIETDFAAKVGGKLDKMIATATARPVAEGS